MDCSEQLQFSVSDMILILIILFL